MPVYEEKETINGQKRWFIRTYVTDEHGNSKQITRHNKEWIGRDGKKEAEREEIRLKNEPIVTKIKKMTLSQLKNEYLEYRKYEVDKDTLRNIEERLNHFCSKDITNQVKTYPNKNIGDFNKEIYEKWQREMRNKKYIPGYHKKRGAIKNTDKVKNYSVKYLNKLHNEICRMIDFALNNGYCRINFARQCNKIGTYKEIQISQYNKNYTTIEYNEYLKLLEVSKNNLKYNTYFDLSFTRGPRPGEIRAFRIKDYNKEKKQLMVNHTMSKKK